MQYQLETITLRAHGCGLLTSFGRATHGSSLQRTSLAEVSPLVAILQCGLVLSFVLVLSPRVGLQDQKSQLCVLQRGQQCQVMRYKSGNPTYRWFDLCRHDMGNRLSKWPSGTSLFDYSRQRWSWRCIWLAPAYIGSLKPGACPSSMSKSSVVARIPS